MKRDLVKNINHEINSNNLTIIDIFLKINESRIRYFHFKSNQHLDKSFEGHTDFDLIVHKQDCYRFEKLLLTFGFKRRVSTFDKFYFGMEDFLYYDWKNERFHHFHIHYDLLFGDKYSKNQHFSNIEYWFDNTIIHDKYPIIIIIPELEIVLLTLRILTKHKIFYNLKDQLKNVLKKYNYTLKYLFKEYEYLLLNIDENKLELLLTDNFSDIKDLIKEFKRKHKQNSLSFFSILWMKKRFNKYRIYDRVDLATNNKFKKARLMIKNYSSCALPNNGKVISFIGPDGAGKTTLTKDIEMWLNYKLNAKYIYLGQVKKSTAKTLTGLAFIILNLFPFAKIKNFFKDYRHIINANYRKNTIDASRKMTHRGIYIITDRFPLREFWSMHEPMDGPRLPQDSILHNKEFEIYNSITRYPDLTIILNVPIEISIQRKPSLHNNIKTVTQIKNKILAVSKLEHIPNSLIIDGSKDYEIVRKKIKQFIFV